MTTYRKEMKGPSFTVDPDPEENITPIPTDTKPKKPPRPTTARERLKQKLIEREKAKLDLSQSER
tara:strand:+ start:279 stop:473 length:195 start_codon:yes stop_codon:yes gene_type:complete